jgi:hypothetical protein
LKLLPPDKADALDKLLRESRVGRGFADAASYADEVIRDQDHAGDFNAWHYVNWPVNKNKYSPFCKLECIIKSIGQQINAAKTATTNDQKALALSWILHLVGDLHQPLHVGDRNDRGGTQVPVTYRGEDACGHITPLHLHKAWDSCLVFEVMGTKSWSEMADDLRGTLTTWNGHAAADGGYKTWAVESHNLARDVAYTGVKKHVDLQDPYITPALAVVKNQLLKGGVRLAKIIDENL